MREKGTTKKLPRPMELERDEPELWRKYSLVKNRIRKAQLIYQELNLREIRKKRENRENNKGMCINKNINT